MLEAATQWRAAGGIDAAIAALAAAFGNRLVTSQAVREQHMNAITCAAGEAPDTVVFLETAEDVQRIMRICAVHHVPVIPFGTGTLLGDT